MTNIEASLPKPIVTALLPDSPDWDETSLLPVSATVQDLPVEVPEWEHIPIPGTETLLTLYWTTGVSTHLIEHRAFESDSYPVISPEQRLFQVPSTYLVQGTHQVWYELKTTNNNDLSSSEKQFVTVDLKPPITAVVIDRLKFDTRTVTEQYLNDHSHQVIAEVPVYEDFKPGDVISWYWTTDPLTVQPGDEVDHRVLSRGDSQPLSVVYPGSLIIASGDGQRYAFYRLTDRAGNASAYSQSEVLEVCAQPVPRVLPSPQISETSGSSSSTLNPLNALNGVHVVIPETAVIFPGETVSVQWGEPGTPGAYRTEPADSRTFAIPSTHVAQHFGKSIPVYYEVFESGVEPPHASSRHTLSVSKITGFPVVQCDKVQGGHLSIKTVADGGYAFFTLQSWPFMAIGQYINIEVRGVNNDNELLVVDVVQEYRVPQVAQQIETGNIAKAQLQRFKLNSQLEVRVRVSFDVKLTWQVFPSLRPTLSA
ncbi:hypothetical protein G7013_18435 [Pseudomonas viridiflava]|nr:hypothetical protein [Pseudomonas viridiflava]